MRREAASSLAFSAALVPQRSPTPRESARALSERTRRVGLVPSAIVTKFEIRARTPTSEPHPGYFLVMSRGNVLVVDDEPTIAEVVGSYLERAGFRTRIAHDGRAALAAVDEHRPDLVVLDLMLPGLDGLQVMRRLRERPIRPLAIILLTARGEESDRVVGLRLGADDYVVKPFSAAELVARVDAVLRRVETTDVPEPSLCFDGLEIDPAGHAVTVGGARASLSQREFDLLLFLARNPGRAFTRAELMERVWQFSFYTDTATVTVHVRRLRSKIETDPANPHFIQTVWGVGYRFTP
jgi:two-component system, OmpR family, response regulator ResD